MILIVNPIPKEDEIPKVKLDTIISEALDEANEKKISFGKKRNSVSFK